MDLNKLLYQVDIWKLKFSREKCDGLHIGPWIIKVEYELSNWEIKRVNGECDLGVGFDDTFKTDNYILFIALGTNGMSG